MDILQYYVMMSMLHRIRFLSKKMRSFEDVIIRKVIIVMVITITIVIVSDISHSNGYRNIFIPIIIIEINEQ